MKRPPYRNKPMEQKLNAQQKKIAQALDTSERNDTMIEMIQLGYSQRELTDLLNVANAKCGVEPYSTSAVQKAIDRRLKSVS